MYLNTGGGARDGEAFMLVKHDGREDHIYGTGKDRKVDRRRRRRREPRATDTTSSSSKAVPSDKAPANETTKAVEGRAYADILTGPRNGLYLNTSGNVRDGQAFVLVKRDGREYHIYGTGKDREIFSLKAPADDGRPTGRRRRHRHDDTRRPTPPPATTPTGSLVTDNP